MRSWRWYSKVLFALMVAAFAYWVWPTPWRYYAAGVGGGVMLFRENRFTGRTQFKPANMGNWRSFGGNGAVRHEQ